MRGYPISPTKKQRPESWLAFLAQLLEISAIANPSARAFPRCVFIAYSCGSRVSGLLHSNGNDRLCLAGGRRKGIANQRHEQSEEKGWRTQESKGMRRRKN